VQDKAGRMLVVLIHIHSVIQE